MNRSMRQPDRLRSGFGAHDGAGSALRKVHGDIDFVMLAKNPTIDAGGSYFPAR